MSNSQPNNQQNLARSARQNTLGLVIALLVVAGILYMGMGFSMRGSNERTSAQLYNKSEVKPHSKSESELVIYRRRDGHFYVRGKINHKKVTFLVDTGAKYVSISKSFARSAGLPTGQPINLNTFKGIRTWHLISNAPVNAGSLARNDITVISGLTFGSDYNALLGQSFLKYYRMEINGNRMTLRPLNQVPNKQDLRASAR